MKFYVEIKAKAGLGWFNPEFSKAILRLLRLISNSIFLLMNKSFRGNKEGWGAERYFEPRVIDFSSPYCGF